MKKTNFILLSAFALSVTLTSCKKGDTGPAGATGSQGSQGPSLTGNVKGYVTHYDYDNAKILSNLAGDSVFIDGTTKSTVTDASGYYAFSNLTTGTYNFTVKRLGFGTDKLQAVQFVGGGDAFHDLAIAKTPTTNATMLTAVQTPTTATVTGIVVSGSVTAMPYAQTVVIYCGNVNASVSASLPGAFTVLYTVNVVANATSFSKVIPTIDFYDAGFVSGNTCTFAAYMIGSTTGSASSYVDIPTNKTIYTALSNSPAMATATIQ